MQIRNCELNFTQSENITKSANNERTKIQNFKKLLARGFAVKDIKDSYQKFIEILEERL